MNKEEFIKCVKKSVRPESTDLFMFTDPSYCQEWEWEEEMSNAEPFDQAVHSFLEGMSDFCDKKEFTEDDVDNFSDTMELLRVTKGQKYR